MHWFFLMLAGLMEITWVIALKFSEGFAKPVPSIVTVLAGLFSFFFLSKAVEGLPISIAYSVWTGIGIMGSVVAGVFLFNDSLDIIKSLAILMIIGGVIILKAATP